MEEHDDYSTTLNKALCYIQEGNHTEALSCAKNLVVNGYHNEALKIYSKLPQTTQTLCNSSLCALSLDKPEEALIYSKLTLLMDPLNIKARYNLIKLYFLLGHYSEYEAELKYLPYLFDPIPPALLSISVHPPITYSSLEFVNVLAHGNFTVIHTCKEKSHPKRTVAVKSADLRRLNKDGFTESITMEAHILSRLSHRNNSLILDSLYSIQHGNSNYLVMPFLGTSELWAVVRVGGLALTSINTARNYMIQALQALMFLHSRGIVHRDFKSENIMVRSDGHIKLIDFGTARDYTRPDIASFLPNSRRVGNRFTRSRDPNLRLSPHILSDTYREMISEFELTETESKELLQNWDMQLSNGSIVSLEKPNILPDAIDYHTTLALPLSESLRKEQQTLGSNFIMWPAYYPRAEAMEHYVGTPQFMAPETLENVAKDFISDMWSLGSTYFQILYGTPPFQGESEFLIFKEVEAGKKKYPRYAAPRERQLIDGLLNPDRSKRYSYAEVVLSPFFNEEHRGSPMYFAGAKEDTSKHAFIERTKSFPSGPFINSAPLCILSQDFEVSPFLHTAVFITGPELDYWPFRENVRLETIRQFQDLADFPYSCEEITYEPTSPQSSYSIDIKHRHCEKRFTSYSALSAILSLYSPTSRPVPAYNPDVTKTNISLYSHDLVNQVRKLKPNTSVPDGPELFPMPGKAAFRLPRWVKTITEFKFKVESKKHVMKFPYPSLAGTALVTIQCSYEPSTVAPETRGWVGDHEELHKDNLKSGQYGDLITHLIDIQHSFVEAVKRHQEQ